MLPLSRLLFEDALLAATSSPLDAAEEATPSVAKPRLSFSSRYSDPTWPFPSADGLAAWLFGTENLDLCERRRRLRRERREVNHDDLPLEDLKKLAKRGMQPQMIPMSISRVLGRA